MMMLIMGMMMLRVRMVMQMMMFRVVIESYIRIALVVLTIPVTRVSNGIVGVQI